ncbi:glucuronate isomerase [Cyclobacteriaceae bacterium]|jgi:glucuronate isomerase|nr:glucuronate isomerase [Cyclobacteriaceae bacterium]|tara:strand:+ start:13920 stop:15320 length:1401 start_codon:yes stop_codon:yes gene_type:complete
MKPFLGQDFLLTNKVAEVLYHDYAAKMPIIDYHNHLSPEDLAKNRQFKNITEAWLEGDHYKWRAMRANGIDEKFITGDTSFEIKFQKWAETVPNTLRNPLYLWSHLELRRYFGIEEILNKHSSQSIYNQCNEKLKSSEYGCKGLLSQMNVEIICTSDDPADDLAFHQKLSSSDFKIKVLPTFRPDKALAFGQPTSFNTYLSHLEEVSNSTINTIDELLSTLQNRIDFFALQGCRLSDHGLNSIPKITFDSIKLDSKFKKIRAGQLLQNEDVAKLQSHVLLELCKMYHAKGWVQQFHLGALRDTNSRALNTLGPATGFDSIGDFNQANELSAFLNELDSKNQLTKTILFNLNPRDNDVFASMTGNFNNGTQVGKMQYGSGWWFLDQKIGMENQINSLSNMGLLSHFVGMLTDSRSFLSFPRHEYFRRVLCNLIGIDVVRGELPNEMAILGPMIENICYNNARNYFEF